MNIDIRLATPEDLPQITSLNKKLFLHESHYDQTYNSKWPESTTGQKYFQDSIKKGIVLVSHKTETPNEIIAYLCGNWDNYSFRLPNPIFEIENMYVSKDFQKQGLGTLLIEKLQKHLLSKNIKRIRVSTIIKNKAAQSFYKKLSFQEHELTFEKSL